MRNRAVSQQQPNNGIEGHKNGGPPGQAGGPRHLKNSDQFTGKGAAVSLVGGVTPSTSKGAAVSLATSEPT